MTDGPIDCRAGDPHDRPRLEDPAVFNRPVEPRSGDLRRRIGEVIAAQHQEGALVGAEVDAVMGVLLEVGQWGWMDTTVARCDRVYLDGGMDGDQRVLVVPMPEDET